MKHLMAVHTAQCAVFSATTDGDVRASVWRYGQAQRNRNKFIMRCKDKGHDVGIQEDDVVSLLTDASRKIFDTVKGASDELKVTGKLTTFLERMHQLHILEIPDKGKQSKKGKKKREETIESLKADIEERLVNFRIARRAILQSPKYSDLMPAELLNLAFSEGEQIEGVPGQEARMEMGDESDEFPNFDYPIDPRPLEIPGPSGSGLGVDVGVDDGDTAANVDFDQFLTSEVLEE